MSQDLYPRGLEAPSQQSLFLNFRGATPRHCGSLRAVTVNGKILNADQDFGMARAIRESVDLALGSEDKNDK